MLKGASMNKLAFLNHLHGVEGDFQLMSHNLFSLSEHVPPSSPPSKQCFLKLGAVTYLLFHLLWSRCDAGCHTHSWRPGRSLADAIEHTLLHQLLSVTSACFNVYSVQLSTSLLSHPDGAVLIHDEAKAKLLGHGLLLLESQLIAVSNKYESVTEPVSPGYLKYRFTT